MPHTFSNINQTRYMQLDEQLEGKGHQKYFLDLRTIRTPLLSNRPSQVSRQHSSSAESVADCASHHLRPHSLSWASGSHHLQRKKHDQVFIYVTFHKQPDFATSTMSPSSIPRLSGVSPRRTVHPSNTSCEFSGSVPIFLQYSSRAVIRKGFKTPSHGKCP